MKKTAVVLFNLGGPDNQDAVEPFLYNLFKDPAIFQLPKFIRLPLAKYVARKRAKTAKEIYAKMGGGSPIVKLTQEQAQALEKKLNEKAKDETYKVFICMRYWHPMSEHAVLQVKYWLPDRVILLPLYPQFSTTTTASSFTDWDDRCRIDTFEAPTHKICCYPAHAGFIQTHAEQVRESYEKAKKHGAPRVLFSAHGLPEKVIKGGDPYQAQVEKTVEEVVKKLGIDNLNYQTCYQSRVGPLVWIGPSTEAEILKAAKENIPLVVVPIAFVSEHSETLVELDIEYKHLFEMNGGKHYFRVPALGVQEGYIASLADMCKQASASARFNKSVAPDALSGICSLDWSKCACAKSR